MCRGRILPRLLIYAEKPWSFAEPNPISPYCNLFATGHDASIHSSRSSLPMKLSYFIHLGRKFNLWKAVHFPGPAVAFFLDGSRLNYECPNSQHQRADESPSAKRSPSLMCMETHQLERKLILLSLGHDLEITESSNEKPALPCPQESPSGFV